MKKSTLIAAAALTVFAACTKNEVKPVENDGLITWQTAADTKATSAYDTGNEFKTWAYFLPTGSTWENHTAVTPSAYIDGETVKYYNAAEGVFTGNTWHTNTAYYWPSSGALTFFSASPATAPWSCTASGEVSISEYTVDKADLMIADIQADQNQNTAYSGFNGVPTTFRHKLARIAGITVQTDKDYCVNVDSPKVGEKRVKLISVIVKNVHKQGNYTVTNPSDINLGGWTVPTQSQPADYVLLSEGTDYFSADTPKILPDLNTFVLPQTFVEGESEIDVVYNVEEWNGSQWVSGAESISKSADLYAIHSTNENAWEINKSISYTLTISLEQNLIYWAPAVEDWDVITVAGSPA